MTDLKIENSKVAEAIQAIINTQKNNSRGDAILQNEFSRLLKKLSSGGGKSAKSFNLPDYIKDYNPRHHNDLTVFDPEGELDMNGNEIKAPNKVFFRNGQDQSHQVTYIDGYPHIAIKKPTIRKVQDGEGQYKQCSLFYIDTVANKIYTVSWKESAEVIAEVKEPETVVADAPEIKADNLEVLKPEINAEKPELKSEKPDSKSKKPGSKSAKSA